ncbi:MAG: MarR family winged helix-turn-helix transcriptional regulator [Clostridium sp.]
MKVASKEELQKYIFGETFLISNKLQTIGDEFLGEITTKQWILLMVMNSFFKDKRPSLSEVAEKLGTSRQNTKQIALKLEKKGFIEIFKDEKDSRVLRIKITEKCMRYAESRGSKDEEFLQFIFNGMEIEELFQMLNSLDKLYNNILSFKMEN